jgi:hypothetical protein
MHHGIGDALGAAVLRMLIVTRLHDLVSTPSPPIFPYRKAAAPAKRRRLVLTADLIQSGGICL